ncbi:PREDICTED: uncharacterized protein LOC108376698 [Rhagoletis zephyria]|uniref:uncharacterized protein LOC108376698 n=1 Tax=Rhagoletis zephyria TaxID=28612 RepID=UPI000811303A|nr:PREDICTED: uncharacterized protein LOC108376698 [Rhagoletis zephyria]
MCARINYIAIFSLFCALTGVSTVVGYDNNRPQRRHFSTAHTDVDTNSEYLPIARDQHPWERRSIPHFPGGSELNVPRNNPNYGESELSSEESTAAVIQHATRVRPAARLNGNVLDTEVSMPDHAHHPWRLERPHRRHEFLHSRWRGAPYQPDSEESSEEIENTVNRRRFNEESEHNFRTSTVNVNPGTGSATVTIHRSIKIVPAAGSVVNVLDTGVIAADPHHPWRVQWPHGRHRFHHLRWHGGHLEPGTDELSGEDEQPDTRNVNNWLRPRNRNEDNEGGENEKSPAVANTSTSTTLVETATSSTSEETTVTRSTEKSIALDETTKTTLKTDDTSISKTTEETIDIDVRGGFA